ncbi:MAG: DUF1013 domain-containing protein [Alphaproteobacteria bacterium]|nr:DUF1013 domain-containing protein [Alphaproteobacteria bacterium]
MTYLLMPKATAAWLVEQTALTFEQIAAFCNLHSLEVQSIADGDIIIQGVDPVSSGQLTWEEIERCAKDPTARLKRIEKQSEYIHDRKRGSRYIPISKRADKPSAIAWLIKNHPELNDHQIMRLLGTTKATILSIRNRTHKDMQNIKSQNPVRTGLCTDEGLRDELNLCAKGPIIAEDI